MPTSSMSSTAATVSGGGTSSTFATVSSGGSTSIVTAETATGWHEFKVQGYSRYKGFDAGKVVYSGTFRVGGHSWSIQYFPGGFGEATADWICFCVRRNLSAADGDVKAEFTLRLLDKDGQPVPSYTLMGSLCIFSSTNKSWGCHRFIKREDLDALYLKDDYFCIKCDLTVALETHEESVVPPPDLHKHLGNLLASGDGGDVTFDVSRETFTAHKSVLAARSPVFMAEYFGGPMKEKIGTRVRIHGIEAVVFKAMLHFIYTDSLPELATGDKMVTAQHLLVAADRYNIERLKIICENILCTFINTSVVATTLVLAEQHGCHRLKEACFKFLKSTNNFKAVGADDYRHLMRRCPSLFDELLAEHGLSSPPCETNKKA